MKYRVIGMALGLIFSVSLVFQLWQVYRFVNSGPRFTRYDGQELCERVKALEVYSYGYRDAGKKPLDCSYMEKGAQ